MQFDGRQRIEPVDGHARFLRLLRQAGIVRNELSLTRCHGAPMLRHLTGGGQPQTRLSYRTRQALRLHDLLATLLHLLLEVVDRALHRHEHEDDISHGDRGEQSRGEPRFRTIRMSSWGFAFHWPPPLVTRSVAETGPATLAVSGR